MADQIKLTTQQDKYKHDHALGILYRIMLDNDAHARDRIAAARLILKEGQIGEDAEARVDKLFKAIEDGAK